VVPKLDLRTAGMEFASEMIVKACLLRLKISEVPVILHPDGRNRPSHLRTWRDGWRHLRFLLMYSPRWLFLLPGLLMMLGGLLIFAWLLPAPQPLGAVTLDVHTLLCGAAAIVIGLQAVLFAVFTKVFVMNERLVPRDPGFERMFHYITLETGLAAGACLVLAGICAFGYALYLWSLASFGALDASRSLRVVIPAVTCVIMGTQIILASFFLSILGLRRQAG
jgi:hypothetical protein